ncbi:MAG: class I SAM-dependent methyltransferase [Gemmataceae bacterium]
MHRQRREILWDWMRSGAPYPVRRWLKQRGWFNTVAHALFGTTVYSRSYYDAIERIEGPSVDVIGEWIVGHLRPRRAVDVGCGPGHQMAALASRGVQVYGVDISDAALQKVKEKGLPADRFDLTGPDPLPGGPYDVAVCCEVAEHLPAAHAPVLVRRLASAAPLVFLTAAEHDPEVGPGLMHLNEQPNGYWIDLMLAETGATLDEPLTTAARRAFADAGVIKYLAKPMIFRRSGAAAP